jgi:ATP-dependent Clp protease adaptor protein ClpS
MSDYEDDVAVIDKSEEDIDIEEPKNYLVIFLNDNYTPMEFVTAILMEIFHKSTQEAESIMLKVHNDGKAVAGIYTYDIALTKQSSVIKIAKGLGFPLKVILEEES